MAIDQHGDAKLDGVSIRSLPKVSLHDHLDGALRPQTIIELADEIDLDVPEGEPVPWARAQQPGRTRSPPIRSSLHWTNPPLA